MGTIYGYARVSTEHQELGSQITNLRAARCARDQKSTEAQTCGADANAE
jgi:DNA invertase Pin-like site-specific DNA recombinase